MIKVYSVCAHQRARTVGSAQGAREGLIFCFLAYCDYCTPNNTTRGGWRVAGPVCRWVVGGYRGFGAARNKWGLFADVFVWLELVAVAAVALFTSNYVRVLGNFRLLFLLCFSSVFAFSALKRPCQKFVFVSAARPQTRAATNRTVTRKLVEDA